MPARDLVGAAPHGSASAAAARRVESGLDVHRQALPILVGMRSGGKTSIIRIGEAPVRKGWARTNPSPCAMPAALGAPEPAARTGPRAPRPWAGTPSPGTPRCKHYFRHTSRFREHQRVHALTRLLCCSKPFAASPTLHWGGPDDCGRCSAGLPAMSGERKAAVTLRQPRRAACRPLRDCLTRAA
jgi:hypothetical protein